MSRTEALTMWRRSCASGRSDDGEDGGYDDELDEYEDGEEHGDEPEDYSDASDDGAGDKKARPATHIARLYIRRGVFERGSALCGGLV